VHRVGQDLPGGEILDAQVALAAPLRVLGPRHVAAIGADLDTGGVVVRVPLGALVLVEDDLLGRARRPFATHDDRELLRRLPLRTYHQPFSNTGALSSFCAMRPVISANSVRSSGRTGSITALA
jgi:hypothetical protein